MDIYEKLDYLDRVHGKTKTLILVEKLNAKKIDEKRIDDLVKIYQDLENKAN